MAQNTHNGHISTHAIEASENFMNSPTWSAGDGVRLQPLLEIESLRLGTGKNPPTTIANGSISPDGSLITNTGHSGNLPSPIPKEVFFSSDLAAGLLGRKVDEKKDSFSGRSRQLVRLLSCLLLLPTSREHQWKGRWREVKRKALSMQMIWLKLGRMLGPQPNKT
ncbi:hypothetical protein HPP92_013341 [Vanilla planifolia]|uniref:Uncharacterized protein n=1 Tax=Vanilla planifolia TaxID=51239 RepID=A0A835R1S1_VANPL|nr:hypothetical protein HPP92_013341 [Vanilla planifolia]